MEVDVSVAIHIVQVKKVFSLLICESHSLTDEGILHLPHGNFLAIFRCEESEDAPDSLRSQGLVVVNELGEPFGLRNSVLAVGHALEE